MSHYFCRLQNNEDFVHKEIRQPDGAQTFRRLAYVKSHRLATQAKSTQVEWRPLIYY